ncbi:vWA domain-containing protein [Bacillus anthracis]|uniref:vWA domain-containing protein n=1 Tax=Bacillus anthracis TaxID=1392 RepID=UPI002DBE1209|nr:VWA domain-containing protein [Bacillus anthracis]MEB9458416.1 VWA domain-containing protein [Bacillus anthracis]
MMNQFVRQEVRPLPVILLLDTSASMYGYKIDALNEAVKEMIKSFADEESTRAEIHVAVVTFGGRAELSLKLTPAREIQFESLGVNGATPLGGALQIVTDLINDKKQLPPKSFRPTIILVSDGDPNDSDWEMRLKSFVTEGKTAKCDRWSLAIGSDANTQVLKQFLDTQEKRVITAADASGIHKFFQFITNTTTERQKSQNPNMVPETNDSPLLAFFED